MRGPVRLRSHHQEMEMPQLASQLEDVYRVQMGEQHFHDTPG